MVKTFKNCCSCCSSTRRGREACSPKNKCMLLFSLSSPLKWIRIQLLFLNGMNKFGHPIQVIFAPINPIETVHLTKRHSSSQACWGRHSDHLQMKPTKVSTWLGHIQTVQKECCRNLAFYSAHICWWWTLSQARTHSLLPQELCHGFSASRESSVYEKITVRGTMGRSEVCNSSSSSSSSCIMYHVQGVFFNWYPP